MYDLSSNTWQLTAKKTGKTVDIPGLDKLRTNTDRPKLLDPNVISVLNNLDEIYDYAKVSLKSNKLPPPLLKAEDGCLAPSFVQKEIFPLIKEERRNSRHKTESLDLETICKSLCRDKPKDRTSW